MDKVIIKDMFILTNKLKRLLNKKYQTNNIHSGQARVLMYLYRNKEETIYQKTIEQEFQIRGGSVTGLIDTLENYDYIKRVDSEIDKRKKKIILTTKGETVALNTIQTARDLESSLYNLLNKEELKIYERVYQKINEWIDKEELA